MKLKIMTFNVLNGWNTVNIGVRDDLAASVVLQELPDVIGFQEFDTCYRLAENPLSKLISEYYEEAGDSHTTWNPIFYNRDKLSLIEFNEEFFKNGTVYEYPLGGHSWFRSVCYAWFEEKKSGKRFLLLNLHYDCNSKDQRIAIENQRNESEQVINLANYLLQKTGTRTLFVTGDYNSKINGMACLKMLQNGFVDTHALAKERDDTGSCAILGTPLGGNYADAAIDHVFYMGDDGLTVNKYLTVDSIRDASDHSPVLVTVEISQGHR